jgi:uncharacterized membrane protein (DUF4010 family)
MDFSLLGTLSLALGLGLLVGLQRERARSDFGGIRTFPLLTLFGTLCGLFAAKWGGLTVAAGLIATAAVAFLANLTKLRKQQGTRGQTTEVAALLMYAVGVLLTTDHQPLAIVIGGITAVMLHLKEPMHAFAGRLSETDVGAIMRFAIVSLIVLPVLPDREFGPFQVLNPREIWLMVVLIVGMGLAGYVSFRLFGARAGVVLGGILGGLVSSTATTVAYARRVRDSASAPALAALIILIASAVAAARVMVEIGVAAGHAAPQMLPPLAALLVLMIVVAAAMLFLTKKPDGEKPDQSNPAQLKSALIFGAIYAAVLFATAAAKELLGGQGLYGVALVSGFVDVDAITLSTSRLAATQKIEVDTAWRLIIVATLSNVVFKTGLAFALGSSALFTRLIVPVGIILAGGIALVLAWPTAGE